jgi:type VI secretion system secreted protein VgrG
MASTRVSYVSGLRAVLYPGGTKFDLLSVLKFRYEEELGQPFVIEIELQCLVDADLRQLIPNKVIGNFLVVAIKRDGQAIRYFHAIVETFVAVDSDGAFNRYRGTAVPWYSLLKLAENSEIYPATNATKLIDDVHKRFKFGQILEPDANLKQSDWKVRTQYRETYFQFLQRSLQQEGLYYYWTHTQVNHTMHTTDGSMTAAPTFPGYESIPYKPSAGDTPDCIYEWSHNAAVQPQQVVLNDYNYLDSRKTLMVTQDNWYRKNLAEGFAEDTPYDRLAVFRHPGSYATQGADDNKEAGTGRWYAKRLVGAFECRQAFVSGKARCVGLAAGHTFKVTWGNTPNPYSRAPYSSPDDKYLTTKMTLEIRPDHLNKPIDDCTFEAIPVNDKITYRPVQTVPTPRIHGVQSAIVCKTEQTATRAPRPVTETRSEDGWQQDATPYCDVKKGVARVQVKFHWCRGVNERTDWIRLTHLMAGNGWGEFHLPRPGDEVLVAFEHGDPDRPVIVGCLYNDWHTPCFNLNTPTPIPPDTKLTPAQDQEKKLADNLKKVFAIKDPGGNLFIMDPGTGTNPSTEQVNNHQTITLYGEGATEPSSIQIGKNDDETPGLPTWAFKH